MTVGEANVSGPFFGIEFRADGSDAAIFKYDHGVMNRFCLVAVEQHAADQCHRDIRPQTLLGEGACGCKKND